MDSELVVLSTAKSGSFPTELGRQMNKKKMALACLHVREHQDDNVISISADPHQVKTSSIIYKMTLRSRTTKFLSEVWSQRWGFQVTLKTVKYKQTCVFQCLNAVSLSTKYTPLGVCPNHNIHDRS